MHLNPDGLLTSEDEENIKKVQEQILEDKNNGTNKVTEQINQDVEQLQNKLNQVRKNLER